jgi:hypothetical protein
MALGVPRFYLPHTVDDPAIQANFDDIVRRMLVGPEEELGIVRGIIDGTGAIVAGTGFTVVKNAAGDYTVTFTKDFEGIPAVDLTVDQAAGTIMRHVTRPTASTFRARNVTTAGVATDCEFHFIAIGPA